MVGDAWNINRIRTNMDDNRGISSVLCYSSKGKNLVDQLKIQGHHIFDLRYDEIQRYRENQFDSKPIPKLRDTFFATLKTDGFKKAAEAVDDNMKE